MRAIILILFSFLTNLSFSQISDTLEARRFWENNIQAIVKLDKQKIISQTKFPLDVNVGDGSWSETEFKARLDSVFTEPLRTELSDGNYHDIDAWVMSDDANETYMVVTFGSYRKYDVIVLMFKEFDGVWKLYGIDFQDEDEEEEE